MKSEQKLTINKLIANDIINYALDDAVCDNYVMGINEYLKDFDEDSKKYINENIDTILDDIEQSECVLDLEILAIQHEYYLQQLMEQCSKHSDHEQH